MEIYAIDSLTQKGQYFHVHIQRRSQRAFTVQLEFDCLQGSGTFSIIDNGELKN